MLQKGPETEEKVWLSVGLVWNPQLRWLTTVCLGGFDMSSPYTSAFSAL